VLLMVLPIAGTGLVLQIHWWAREYPSVAIWTLGLSLLLALIVLKLRAATLAGAATGAIVTASLMFSTVGFPYQPWHTALAPVLTVSLLAWLATRAGRARKETIGTAESQRGRSAAQVAANLGMAALACLELVQSWLIATNLFSSAAMLRGAVFAPGLAALAEAAADTVSSELGQVLGGRPRLITNWGSVEPGEDGAISLAGTVAGVAAAAIVAGLGSWTLRGDFTLFWISGTGAAFGLFFDSLLGATLEKRGWLNNDAVNFLSTASAAAFALGLLALLPHAASSMQM
jgi:uncharacterized protein (TIGR00297 family)